MSDKDEKEDFGKPFTGIPLKNGQPDFTGNHGCCRDFFCLVIFLGCIVACIVIFAMGFSTGEPSKLIYPLSTDDQYCGKKESTYDLTDFPYLYRPTLTDSSLEICISDCPKAGEFVCKNGSVYAKDKDPQDEANCYKADYKYTDILYRCFPDAPQEVLDEFEEYSSLKNVFTLSVNDLIQSWWVFLIAAAAGIIFSFGFMLCMRFLGKCIIWTLIILCLVALLVVGGGVLIYGIKQYNDAETDQDKTNSYVFIGFGAGALFIDLILFLIIIGLRSRINLAMTLIGEASKVFSSSPCLCIVPLIYIILFIISAILLIITMVYYFSSLDITTNAGHREIQTTSSTRYVVIFVLFMFLWAGFFFIGMNQSTISGTAAVWYFSAKDARGNKKPPTFTILRALKILLLHHIGSVALGSFLIALVVAIRAAVLYIQKKMKEKGQLENAAMKCLFSCLNCCLKCLQKIVEYIVSRAYIMMMIRGKSFIPSAVDAVKLLLRNPLRTALLSSITKVVIFCGILLVTAICTFVSIVIVRPDFLSLDFEIITVYYWWFIILICAIISFGVAYLVLSIYDFLIDTIFHCFLIDEEITKNNSSWTPYATQDLLAYFDEVPARNKSGVQREVVNVDV